MTDRDDMNKHTVSRHCVNLLSRLDVLVYVQAISSSSAMQPHLLGTTAPTQTSLNIATNYKHPLAVTRFVLVCTLLYSVFYCPGDHMGVNGQYTV